MTGPSSPWPDPDRIATIIRERFEFLCRDYGFVRRSVGHVDVAYDLSFLQAVTRVAITTDKDVRLIEVAFQWPDERMSAADPAPMITLGEIVEMRAPGLDVPRDLATERSAEETINRLAALIPEVAIDIVSGGLGVMSDYVAWKRATGDLGEGQWWGHPIYEELASVTKPRTPAEIQIDFEFATIHALVHRDPERAWPNILGFIGRHPDSMEAITLLEDVMLEHGDSFIDRIEELARSDATIREMVEGTHLGGHAGPAIDRLEELQAEIRGQR